MSMHDVNRSEYQELNLDRVLPKHECYRNTLLRCVMLESNQLTITVLVLQTSASP